MPTTECGFENRPDVLVHYGPTLYIEIGFDPNFRPNSEGKPDLSANQFPALVDTGASVSCIDSGLAMELDLPIVDRRDIAGAHGSGAVDFHLAQIYVPSLHWTIFSQFAGVHLIAGGQPHYALIGRDFLQNFTMTYEGPTGVVTLNNNPDSDRIDEPKA